MSRTLKHSDFQRGMVRDAAQIKDHIRAMRTIKNYQYDYGGDEVRLKMRKGYDRYNAVALANPAQQLYWFEDSSGNTHLLGIYDSKWYRISETGAHLNLGTETSTARRPIVQVGDRVFYGTDAGLRWADNSAITGSPKSYRVGIERPSEAPTLETRAPDGHTDTPDPALKIVLNTDTQERVAIKFSLTARTTVGSVYVSLRRFEARQDLTGSVRVRLYTDNSGEPSTTLLDSNAISDWMPVSHLSYGSWANKRLRFPVEFDISPSTDYWIVLETDDAYKDNYLNAGLSTDFHAGVGHEDAPASYKYGKTQVYSNVTSAWSELNKEAVFQFGGFDADTVYEYVLTYRNTTYGIESRPSPGGRIEVTTTKPVVFMSGYPTSSDDQVDVVRVYRRTIPEIDSLEADITDTYKFVSELTPSQTIYDILEAGYLGAELQTDDHYELDYTDDSSDSLRSTAIVPKYMCVWKGRILLATGSDNNLWFTKRLESDGATGQTGDSVYDYIPLENIQEMPVASPIIGLEPLSRDQLAVYFKNEEVWVIRGMNEVLNPPSDIGMRPILTTDGLFAPPSLNGVRGRHVYMSREGVQIFNGTPNPEHISSSIQSIFDAIESDYLDDSIIAVFGDEIWVLVDDDNDGNKESIYIIDLQQPGGIWRLYDYGVNLNDLITRRTGNTFRTLLAADADSNYVLELETGTTDNGQPIEAMIETHDMDVDGNIAVIDVEMRGYYPNAPASYDVTVIDHLGQETGYTISPASSDDIRGHHTGTRVMSSNRIRVKVEQRSVNEDEVHGFSMEYVKV